MTTDNTTQNAAATTEQATAPFSLTREVQFNFKKVKEEELLKTLEDNQKTDDAFMAQFEVITDGEGEKQRRFLKRKSFKGKITLPSFVAAIPETDREFAASVFERELQQFVKTQYVDNYEPIGDHSLTTYKAVMSTRASRSSAWDYTEDQFKAALESLAKYISAATANDTVGEKFSAAANQKFSRSSIQRFLGNFSEDLIKRISARLNDWGAYLVEKEPDNAEEFNVIYDMWSAALDRHMQTDSYVDVSKFL